jgi:hypothetical protein
VNATGGFPAGRVGLKDPTRPREVFTVARARGEKPAPDRPQGTNGADWWFGMDWWPWAA